MNYKIFTSESVCSGHPDKIADQISDSILDECLKGDSQSRVAVETLVTTNKIILAGEVTTKSSVDYEKIARKMVKSLGFEHDFLSFDYKSAACYVFIHEQSKDIAKGVLKDGAGDQGMMFGYACKDTQQLMPLPITIAHEITKGLDQARVKKTLPYLRPDGKSQVTIEYENGIPKKVLKVVTAVPHDPKVSHSKLSKEIYEVVIMPILKKYSLFSPFSQTVCNGTGNWEIGGPASDTGLTGRKLMVDNYGAISRVGGGCFSGKDPTKVDRSAAYAARYIAKNIVKKGFASKCEVQLAYVIGKALPVTQAIETFATESIPLEKIEKYAWSLMDLSVAGIIKKFDLQRPIYKKTAVYGHFGRPEFPWEKTI